MSLIIHDFALILGTLNSLELTAHDSIPDTDEHRCHQEEASVLHNHHTDVHHHRVQDAEISGDVKVTFLIDLGEAHEHICAGNANVVESGPTVVLREVALLGTEVTSLHTGQVLPGVQVAELNHEWLDAVVHLVDLKSGKDNSMRSVTSQITRPVLGRCKSGAVDHKLIRGLVQSGSGLNASDVGAVTELSLGVATPDPGLLDEGHPFLLLLFGGESLHGKIEHGVLETHTREQTLELVSPPMIRVLIRLEVVEVLVGVVLEDERYSLHHVVLHLLRSHLVEFMSVVQHLVLLDVVVDGLELLELFLAAVNEVHELLLVKVALGSLVLHVRGNDLVLEAAFSFCRSLHLAKMIFSQYTFSKVWFVF